MTNQQRKLRLKDARERLKHAKKQHERLTEAFGKWNQTGGIQLIGRRHPEFCLFQYNVHVTQDPEENLSILAGDVVHNLRVCLDYIATAIYTAGGGDIQSDQIKAVQFPIVRDEQQWAKTVAHNVPFAWDEAIEKLQWCQPYVQFQPNTEVLPVIQGLGSTDKHQNLILFAMAVMAINGISPEFTGDLNMNMLIAHPAPAIEIGEPKMLGRVYLEHGDAGIQSPNFARWSEGIDFREPKPPEVVFGFRANDGSEVRYNDLPHLIAHVEQILELFAKLKIPATTTPTP